MYCEEMDWQQRMQAAGWPIACVPAAQVIHVGGASTSQFRLQSFLNLWYSRKRYFDRFASSIHRFWIYRLIQFGMWAKAAEAKRSLRASRFPGDVEQESKAKLAAAEELYRLFGRE